MRARLMNGYWIGKAPSGYHYERVSKHGKLMVRNEPVATIVQEALESYACGRLNTRPEIKDFFEKHPAFPKGRDGRVHYQRVDDLLNNPLYAGYVHFPNWGVSYQPGQHEAIISVETWHKIQSRLQEQAKTPARIEVQEDFPLRGFVTCACCGQQLTACWSKGKYKTYPYYLCYNKDCPDYKKSIRKEAMERAFDFLLESLRPSESMFQMVVQMLRDIWEQSEKNVDRDVALFQKDYVETEKKIEQLMDRILETDTPSLVKAYEERLKGLELHKAALAEKRKRMAEPRRSFNQTFRTSLEFLRNPQKLWVSERIDDKKLVLKLVFAKPLEYCRKSGFRTPLTSCPFRLFSGFEGGKKEMVDPIGIEPTTSTMPLWRSPS